MSGHVEQADPDQLNGVWAGTWGAVPLGSADHRLSRGAAAAPVVPGREAGEMPLVGEMPAGIEPAGAMEEPEPIGADP
jgi:hypothetical protein